MLRKKVVLITSTILTVIVLIHFSFTFIYLTPYNSFREEHWEQINNYMSPVFTQNWKLFAPNPVSRHENIQVRFRYTDAQGKTKKSKWMEITKPIVHALQQNHFSPHARMLEFANSATHNFVWQKGERKKTAQKNMKIFAQHVFKDNLADFQVNGKINMFQLRVEVNEFPRFEKRKQPDSKGKFSYNYTIWYPMKSTEK